jgi:hypothetical protein
MMISVAPYEYTPSITQNDHEGKFAELITLGMPKVRKTRINSAVTTTLKENQVASILCLIGKE